MSEVNIICTPRQWYELRKSNRRLRAVCGIALKLIESDEKFSKEAEIIRAALAEKLPWESR